MEGPDELVILRGLADEREALERALGQVEGRATVLFEEGGDIGGVQFLPWEGEGIVDGGGFGGEGGAEDGMGRGEGFPSGAEAGGIDGFREGSDHLLDVDACGRVLEPRKIHALMQWSQRQGYFWIRQGGGHAGKRSVRRSRRAGN